MHSKRFIAILGALICVCCVGTSVAISQPFSSDVDSINQAALSVLMLDVFDKENKLIRSGSGFVAFDNYTLITNEHVVEDAALIIGSSDAGNQYMITKLIAVDEKKDIAILEFFSPTDLSPLLLRDNAEIKRAETVVTIGSPLGFKNSVSIGNISALYEEDGTSLIQFTAPISPGSSGGALFNDQGQVIGITSAIFTEGQNINLAVNIEEAKDLFETNRMSQRISLTEYAKPSPTSTAPPTPKPTAKPTTKPTVKPSPTIKSLYGSLSFGRSKSFDGSTLAKYKGYEYDIFEKSWRYSTQIQSNEPLALMAILTGDNQSLNGPPQIVFAKRDAESMKKNDGSLIKAIDILVGDTVFTFERLRYMERFTFFYLGSTGRQMVEAMAKAKNISVRLTLKDSIPETYNINSQAFAPLKTWCTNIVKQKVFDYYQASDMSNADSAHNASVD